MSDDKDLRRDGEEPMTRAGLLSALAGLDRFLSRRIIVTRIIVDEDGHEVGRISRSYFQRSRP